MLDARSEPAIEPEPIGFGVGDYFVLLVLAALLKEAYFLEILFGGVENKGVIYPLTQHNKFVLLVLERCVIG